MHHTCHVSFRQRRLIFLQIENMYLINFLLMHHPLFLRTQTMTQIILTHGGLVTPYGVSGDGLLPDGTKQLP